MTISKAIKAINLFLKAITIILNHRDNFLNIKKSIGKKLNWNKMMIMIMVIMIIMMMIVLMIMMMMM